MKPLAKLTYTEAKIFLREPANLIFVLGLPIALLVVLGNLPGFRETHEEFGGQSVITSHLPAVMVLLALAVLACGALPAYLATYREKGIFRRLSTTPVSPAQLLTAHLITHVAMAFVAVVLLLVAGSLAVGVRLPGQVPGFAAVLVLGMASLLAIGLLIGALAPSGAAATAIGNVVLFPLLFLGGMWIPRELMPDALRSASDFSPMGALVAALRETWVGNAPGLLHIAVMAGYALAAGALAARTFRWE
jgi:ABC-2 type transport system permease protein